MTYYIRNGNTFRPADEANLDLHNNLPADNYTVKVDQYGNLFLEVVDTFEMPKKVYGDALKNADRILNTYRNRTASTGVMLTGEKGSGKTLLAKMLSINGADLGIPTIVINSPMRGEQFNTFIQSIDQECIILFDEFEKVYDRDEQTEILTLLDGVYPTKKLFILTCNDKYRVDSYMKNRPGRIFYLLEFNGLDPEFIRQYCEDNLNNKSYIDTMCNISTIFDSFNFDMLKAMVEEMNRYDESPQDVLKIINVRQEFDEGGTFDVTVLYRGIESLHHDFDDGFRGNPMRGFDFSYRVPDAFTVKKAASTAKSTSKKPTPLRAAIEAQSDEWREISFSPNDMTRIEATKGLFEFEKGDVKVTFVRQKVAAYNYMAF